MAYLSRSTSPDPLTAPSSPLPTTRTANPRSRSSKPLAPRSNNNFSSPSKSFIMDTGKAGDGSPWRIRVTVEAEPKHENSPAKRMTRTTTVPLKIGSSSPVRKGRRRAADDGSEREVEVKRPQRKRKGTPMRRNTRREQASAFEVEEDVGEGGPGHVVMSQKLQEELSSPSKRPASARRKCVQDSTPTERSKRLTRAREELDIALQEAIGSGNVDEPNSDDVPDEEAELVPGDMTVANEDFTMVSVETLESMKQNTSLLLDNSAIDNSGVGKSVGNMSYWPSSPPKPAEAREVQGENVGVQYPDIAAVAEATNRTDSRKTVAAPEGFDAMSWKPTGPVVITTATPPATKSPPERTSNEPSELRRHREGVRQDSRNTNKNQVIDLSSSSSSTPIDAQAIPNAEEEEDIWAEEASRSLGEEEQQEEQRHPTHQPQPHVRPKAQRTSTAEALNGLFSDPPRPLRSKIPRTWRRTSGVEFSYVDSPEYGVLKGVGRKLSGTGTETGTETDGEGRSSVGVLTPPDSSDDDQDVDGAKPTGPEEEAEEMDFTHPDAAATQLEDHRPHISPAPATAATGQTARDEALSPFSASSESSSDATSPEGDGEDTGMFWQTNLPNVYRGRERPRVLQRQQQRAGDLSALLRSSSPGNNAVCGNQKALVSTARPPPKDVPAYEDDRRVKSVRTVARTTSRSKGLQGRVKNDLIQEKVVSSPLRKSLLKSSRLGGHVASVSPEPARDVQHKRARQPREASNVDQSSRLGISTSEQTFGESFESKASDQRQLLAEMNVTRTTKERAGRGQSGKGNLSVSGMGSHDADKDGSSYLPRTEIDAGEQKAEGFGDGEQEEDYDEDEPNDEPTRSYEEHLNVASPQKIRVKFNDSEGNSSLLEPKKDYSPLFDNQRQPAFTPTAQKPATPPSVTLIPKHPTTEPTQPSIFTRLSTTFWAAVIRPSGPTLVPSIPEPEYSPTLRTHIRSRYGVLSDQHPWTMSHMRTLHRLLNSCTSGKSDSLVPKSGPLPAALEKLIGKELQCVTEFRWTFTEQHAHVVDAFMRVLVPAHYIEGMRAGDIDFIGDDLAKSHRGMIMGRHGDDIVFYDGMFPGMRVPKQPRGTIQRDFVVKAVGNVVSANIQTAEREAREAEERARGRRERRVRERRNRAEEDEDEENSEELQKVVMA